MDRTSATPTPTPINWLGYLAVTLLVTLVVAVLTVRSGSWQQGLLLYAISCAGSGLLLLLAVIGLLLPRFARWRKTIAGWALWTLPGSVLLLSVLGSGDFPPIHDISTDLQDPPVFTAAQQQRGAHSNSLEPDPATIAQQREGYPDLHTSRSSLSIDAAFDDALAAAAKLGWDIYFQDRNAGFIEAVDTTPIMGFKDDVVIRLRTDAEGTLIDVRSISRVGGGDMGANASRIRAFQQLLQP